MKLLHLSDLHLGKRVNGFSMLEDQAYILSEILGLVAAEAPDAVCIAGDVYDKPLPPAEAVALFDDFLVRLAARGAKVFVIAGNHDSPERIAFGGRLMRDTGVYMSPVYTGSVAPVECTDAFGAVNVYLLPFVRPAQVKRFFPEAAIDGFSDALRVAIGQMAIDPTRRNILITHQFVTGAARCDSEEVNVGGADNVDAAVFDDFDYVALGHIHNPQHVSRSTLRYCGTPIKYSFSEARHEKSATVVELREKGDISVREAALAPLHDLREIRGAYDELTLRDFYAGTTYPRDYMHITLTDEADIPDAIGKLRVIYPNIMKLDYDNLRTRASGTLPEAASEEKTPLALLETLYERQNNQPMSDAQRALAAEWIERIWEENA